MSSRTIRVEDLEGELSKILSDYADVTAEGMKKAVRKAGNSVRKEISETAPKKTGRYAKSWSVKTVKNSGHEIGVVVHSKNRYSLTHLLENGHALRNGGRARAFPHIAPAEEHALTQLETDIRKEIGNG